MSDDIIKRLRFVKHTADWEACDEAAARLDKVERENERLRSAINWACGYDEGEPHFGEQPEQRGAFAWRHELRRRAGMPWRVVRVSTIDAARAAEPSDERREG